MEREVREILINRIIGYCIDVHKELGPGFLETVYHKGLEIKFKDEELNFESEKEIPVYYQNKPIGTHKLDFLIEDEIVLEIKTVEEIQKKDYAQLRSYLKAVDKEMGLLINFADFKLDIRRVERNK